MSCCDESDNLQHLKLNAPQSGTGTGHHHVNLTTIPGVATEIDWLFDDGNGTLLSGKALAKSCVAEWETILKAADPPA
jgi:hypothetical protein